MTLHADIQLWDGQMFSSVSHESTAAMCLHNVFLLRLPVWTKDKNNGSTKGSIKAKSI